MESKQSVASHFLEDVITDIMDGKFFSGGILPVSPDDGRIVLSRTALTQLVKYVTVRAITDPFLPSDFVRVLRVIEYKGSRESVEKQLKGSLHGTRLGSGYSTISAATLSTTGLEDSNATKAEIEREYSQLIRELGPDPNPPRPERTDSRIPGLEHAISLLESTEDISVGRKLKLAATVLRLELDKLLEELIP